MEEPKANLRGCPCCAGQAVVRHRIVDTGYFCFGQCLDCNLRTDDVLYDRDLPVKTGKAAVKEVEVAWNRREG